MLMLLLRCLFRFRYAAIITILLMLFAAAEPYAAAIAIHGNAVAISRRCFSLLFFDISY